MRFIFYNPQKSAFFGTTLLNYLSKIHSTTRYKYLIHHSYKNNKLNVLITKSNSSFPNYISKYIPIEIEFFLWALVNKINPFKVTILNDLDELKKTDILFSQTFRNFDNKNSSKIFLKKYKFLKAFHITHYNNFTSILAKNIKNINPKVLIAENNLYKNSPYFKKFFKTYKKNVYVLPYVFEKRFHKFMAFDKRINKCLSTGSIVSTTEQNVDNQFTDFNSYYKVNSLTPLRDKIYKNKDKINQQIDTLTSKVFDHEPKISNPNTNIFIKIYNSIYNGIAISKMKYFKHNLVDKYNQYKMFVIAEELTLPSVGFVEGMACGCAYIGINNPMYTDLGLIPNVHYISYNNTLSDLLLKIKYYQNHPKELSTIANNGYKFVTKHFNPQTVSKQFDKDLKHKLIKSSFTSET